MSDYRYCPRCGAKFTYKNLHGRKRLFCPSCNFIFYQNPKPAVAVFIAERNKVLLAQRAIEPFKGWWDSIGGFMEEGEAPAETAIREAKEETGLDIELLEILGIGKDKYEDYSTVPISYLGKINGGELKPADDVAELKWFTLDRLPSSISFEGNKKILKILQERYSH